MKGSKSVSLNANLGKAETTSTNILGEQEQQQNTVSCISWQCVLTEDIRKTIKTELRARMWLRFERPPWLEKRQHTHKCYPYTMDRPMDISPKEVKFGISGTPCKWSQASKTRAGKTLREAKADCHKEKGKLLVDVQHYDCSWLYGHLYVHTLKMINYGMWQGLGFVAFFSKGVQFLRSVFNAVLVVFLYVHLRKNGVSFSQVVNRINNLS